MPLIALEVEAPAPYMMLVHRLTDFDAYIDELDLLGLSYEVLSQEDLTV
ncbi:MAG: hypothetical protein AAF984_10355 [Verrucomicrobiota bacterium]